MSSSSIGGSCIAHVPCFSHSWRQKSSSGVLACTFVQCACRRDGKLSWYLGIRYFLGQRFCVLCFENCTSSLFSTSPLWSSNFKIKRALNLSPNKQEGMSGQQQPIADITSSSWSLAQPLLIASRPP